jgi:L-ascorbate metabolism protein UlaG (beta-lactamase superfamily)
MQANITYIDHSGFLIELPDVAFLFDYYQGEIPKIAEDKPLVVFVSHRHQDHYNPEIFELLNIYSEIYFVLAKGVPVKRQMEKYTAQGIDLERHMILIKRNVTEQLILNSGKRVEITTLKSTDEGVAFLLSFEGKTIYHGGDLNQWVWEGESKQYNDNMRNAYLREMTKLDKIEIDAAFVPVDPRLEKHAFEGLKVFVEHGAAKKIYPMHFWGEFGIISKLLEKYPEYQGMVRTIEKTGQLFAEEL